MRYIFAVIIGLPYFHDPSEGWVHHYSHVWINEESIELYFDGHYYLIDEMHILD